MASTSIFDIFLSHSYKDKEIIPALKYEIEKTEIFDKWLKKLRDRKAVLAIVARLDRAKLGNFGDVEPIGYSDWRRSGRNAHISRPRLSTLLYCPG